MKESMPRASLDLSVTPSTLSSGWSHRVFPRNSKPASGFLLTCAGFLVIAADSVYTFGRSPTKALAFLLPAILLGMAGISRTRGEAPVHPGPRRSVRVLWVILAALAAFHCVLAVPLCQQADTHIDTYTFLRDSCKTLLAGADPYGGTQADIYGPPQNREFYGPGMVTNGRVKLGFPYPPLQLLWGLTGYLLGDVRFSYILAVVLAACFLFSANPGVRSLWVAGVLLLNPLTFYVEDRCWNEPLVLLALCAALYTARRHPAWLPLALGLFLAAKQYNIVALPFLGCLLGSHRPFSRPYWRLFGLSCAVAALTLLPFALWNLHGFWRDLVLFNLQHPFRRDTLTFAARLPFLLHLRAVLVILFLVWAVRVCKPIPAMFVAGYALALTVLVSTDMAFANYYFLIAQALLVSVTVPPEIPYWQPMAPKDPEQVQAVVL